MSSEEQFEAFMQKVTQRSLPSNPMARIRTFAKELAEGVLEDLWENQFSEHEFEKNNLSELSESDGEESKYYREKKNKIEYIKQRWGFVNSPNLNLLVVNGYLSRRERQSPYAVIKPTSGNPTYTYIVLELTKAAFELLNEVESSTVFISYKRSESSSFALLVNTRLKAEGLNSYLDMAIPKGDDWQKRIKDEIERHDYFVFLLGKQSLSSDVVRQELAWAIQFGKVIIPIWHNEYEYKSGEFPVLLEADEVLKKTNAIIVSGESALAYHNAIVELLNRFGITP
jgi:hypothetical protein